MKIAINGFGRIGRTFFKQAIENEEIQIIAINDLGDLENLAYLLKYDTVYGRYKREVKIQNSKVKIGVVETQGKLIVDDKEVLVFSEKDPKLLPWGILNIDIVVESTGVFTNYEGASQHLTAGAKRVVVTAPAQGEIPHLLVGANDLEFQNLSSKITSNASCTTNAIVPLAQIMAETVGIVKGMMTTVHAYTATQSIVDSPGKKGDFLRGRSAAQNIVPSHTGAAEAVIKSLPNLEGIFEAIAMRVPIITGSIVDFTFLAKRKTSKEEINDIFKKKAEEDRWKKTLKVTTEPLTSSDIIGEPYGAIVDLTLTKVIDGDLVKVFSWYDNEWGYSATLVNHILSLKPSL